MICTYAFKDLMVLPQTLHLRGVCPQFGTFTINFIDAEGVNLLHFSFRIDQRSLVINENHTGDWGEEQEVTDVTFPTGRPFVIRVEIAEESAIRVFMDEKLLTGFTWRTDVRKASRIDLTDVEFALFREDDIFKTHPEDTAFPPPEVSGTEISLGQVMQRIDDLIGVQIELAARIGDIMDILSDVKKQQGNIAASVKSLQSRSSTPVESTSRRQEKVA